MIIVSFTGPSACGKTTLLDYIKAQTDKNFGILKGTTTRPKRAGETDEHYYFVDSIKNRKFIELNQYGGNHYGIEEHEFNSYADSDAVFAILDPNGVASFQKFCKDNGHTYLNYFIYCNPDERLERLKTRIIEDTAKDIKSLKKSLDRFQMTFTEEHKWYTMNYWYRTLIGSHSPEANFSIITNDIKEVKTHE